MSLISLARRGRAVALVVGALMLVPLVAEARPGGGRSSGSRGSFTNSAPPSTNTTPGGAQTFQRSAPSPSPSMAGPSAGAAAAQAARPSFARNMMMGIGAGLLGAGLFGMLSGSGFFGGLASLAGVLGFLLQLALIAGIVMLAIRFFRRRSEPQLAGAGAPYARQGHDAPQPAAAANAARRAGIPALIAEIGTAHLLLDAPAGRLITGGTARALSIEEVEALQATQALVVDACRHLVRGGERSISLATRPVLFALARALGEAWPEDVPRGALIARAFGSRLTDESHRARLRVEIGRLRAELQPVARVNATREGFLLVPRPAREVLVLARPEEEGHAAVLALLADGEPWSSSALALALGTSQRGVQRALEALAAAGKIQAYGQGRARRWTTPPMPGLATGLLLTGPWATG
ncbi:hypothetical protein ARD30_06175 [Bosea thiooxidans]|uniref:Helix-turn-helix domain-containing protein n=1 Tax=Bosea thiooxidans TaxID=53254 RepID=A0A0Q3KX23_9HYPH|nr:hypothetical protein [Bosea thiooxidans]KQK28908.1 hypothetical protein ARD30_06175 [Bosea thiooxidans]